MPTMERGASYGLPTFAASRLWFGALRGRWVAGKQDAHAPARTEVRGSLT